MAPTFNAPGTKMLTMSDDKSNKYYRITVHSDEAVVTNNWGQLDDAGQPKKGTAKAFQYPSMSEAIAGANKSLQEKMSKGYTLAK